MEQAYLPGTVRHRIQELIKERKITQAELAAEIGMAESSLSRFLSEKTDKIGDEYIIKIADFLGVSTDFILGQTAFPERRNYDIEELGLSYKSAMALYTREVDTDVVNRILESPQFPEITRMIARYFKDSNAEGPAGLNAMWDTMRQMIGTLDTSHLTNPQEGTEAAAQILGMMKTAPHEKDVEAIQAALMPLYTVQILPQNRFPAHSVYQRHLHAGQLNIRRHQVHALRVAQNPLAGADRLIGQDAAHCVREGKGQLIRLGIAQADGQAPLRVPVNEKHFLSGLCQSNP